MNRSLILLLALSTSACTVTTRTAPPPREVESRPEPRPEPRPERPMPPPPPRPTPPPFTWDTSGWTMIGERTVNGKLDADSIQIDPKLGHFTKLTVVVLDSDLELLEMNLNFKSGQHYATDLKNVIFKEDTRTRVIPLPSEVLTHVDFRYRNLAGGGDARIQLWGSTATPPPPAPPVWDSKGWVEIGERMVDGTLDADRFEVDPKLGVFKKLTVVVLDSDLEIIEMVVNFKSGRHYPTDVKNLVFRENTRTRVITLASERLTSVDFKYRNLVPKTRARVQLWGHP